MSNIIPFESGKLPSSISSLFQVEKLGVGGIGGFPHISIKGKVFTIVRGDEREIVMRPGEEEEPAGSIDVVIIKQNPNRSKVYYEGGYTEGSDAKPICFSNDGIKPDAQAAEPQCKTCQACPHNQWGARITESGKKAKACSDSQRIAIAPLGLLNDPMLLRIPAASLKTFEQYGNSLFKRGVPYQTVVTKIGFDYAAAHPSLTFKALGYIDDASAKEVFEVSNESVTDQIVGITASGSNDLITDTSEEFQQPAPSPVEKAVEPEKPKKSTSAFSAGVQAKEPEPAKAETQKVAKAPIVEVDTGDLAGEIADVMSGLDFDDE